LRTKPFVFVKISDYGTSTPVVARTTLQAQRLNALFPLPREVERRIFEVMFEVQRRDPKGGRRLSLVHRGIIA
jgi:hypothetical protein